MTKAIPELWDQLEKLIRQFSRRKIFSTMDINLPDLRVLQFIAETGECNMTDIVNGLSLAASTATGVIDRFVQKSYVKRKHSQQDRRKIYLEMTQTGREAFKRIRATVLLEVGKLLNSFTEGEINELSRLLEKMTTLIQL